MPLNRAERGAINQAMDERIPAHQRQWEGRLWDLWRMCSHAGQQAAVPTEPGHQATGLDPEDQTWLGTWSPAYPEQQTVLFDFHDTKPG